jgi:hypothetical protein
MVEVGNDMLEKVGTLHNVIDALVKPVSIDKFGRYCESISLTTLVVISQGNALCFIILQCI